MTTLQSAAIISHIKASELNRGSAEEAGGKKEASVVVFQYQAVTLNPECVNLSLIPLCVPVCLPVCVCPCLHCSRNYRRISFKTLAPPVGSDCRTKSVHEKVRV